MFIATASRIAPALVFLSSSLHFTSSSRLTVLYNEYNDGSGPNHLSILDPSTGIIDSVDARTLVFPDPSPDCQPGWTLSNGTYGQTTAIFRPNQTAFILAQETCTNYTTKETIYRNATLVRSGL
jgi:hypothetical protein